MVSFAASPPQFIVNYDGFTELRLFRCARGGSVESRSRIAPPMARLPMITPSRSTGRPTFLVLEEEADAGSLLQAAFTYGAPGAFVQLASTTVEAADYLLGAWPYSDRVRYPLPTVVIVGIASGGVAGLSLVRWLATSTEEWATVPIVTLIDSSDQMSRHASSSFGAVEVRERPADFPALVELVQGLAARWAGTAGAL